jgi:hypothetical protein
MISKTWDAFIELQTVHFTKCVECGLIAGITV